MLYLSVDNYVLLIMNTDPIEKYSTLAAEGLAPLPIRLNDKVPATQHGHKDANKDPEKHLAWANECTDYNVAYATGPASGHVLVLDVDVKNGDATGLKSIQRLEKEHGPLPPTRKVFTPSGGYHLIYRYPEDLKVPCRINFLPRVDVKAEGGYCLAPPSVINGEPYFFEEPVLPISSAPSWLLDLVCSKQSTKPRKRKSVKSKSVATGNRNDSVACEGFSLLNAGLDPDLLEEELLEYNAANCDPPLPESEVCKIAANVASSHQKNNETVSRATDLGNAKRMSELYSDELRYVSEMKRWLEKTESGAWRFIDELRVLLLAREIIPMIHDEMRRLAPGSRKELMDHAKYTESNKALKDAVELFRSEPGIAVSATDLDDGEWVFPAKNGLIDLRTGRFMPMNPALHITQTAGVNFDPDATCPLWEKFLLQITNGNVELVEYLRWAIGYTLTSQTSEHALFFAFGSGANGKSTFLNLLRALFGDLGAQANGDMLLDKNGGAAMSSNAASSEVARLAGKRLVAMSEVEEGRHFSEKTVKWYTGGEVITARMLYQNAFEFKPRFKLWLAGNYKPTIKGNDHGIWRRMKLIPFTVTIPPEKRDPDLERKLREELPGILNWALVGCKQWRENGYKLKEPAIITNEVSDYRGEMDVVESWLSEFTRDDPNGEIHFGDAYKFFKSWSEAEYNFSYSRKRLGMILQDKGYKPAAKPHRVYKGLSLLVGLTFNEHTGAYVSHEFYDYELELRKLGWQNKLLAEMTGEDVGLNDEEVDPA